MEEIPINDRIQWYIDYLNAYLQGALSEEERIFERLNRSTLHDAIVLLSLLEKYRFIAGCPREYPSN
jgi:hypothetical protein